MNRQNMTKLALAALMMVVSAAVFASGNTEDDGITQDMRYVFPRGGIEITTVESGSSADAAGLEVGDVIIGVNGEHVQYQYLAGLMSSINPGDQLTLNVVRPVAEDDQRLMPEEHIIELIVGSGSDGQAVIGLSVTANMSPEAMAYGGMRNDSMGRRGGSDMMRSGGRGEGYGRGYFDDDSNETEDDDDDDNYSRRSHGYFMDDDFDGDL